MKITKLTTFIVPPRWCFLKVETDQGVTGWGEPVVEGRAHTVAAAVEEVIRWDPPLQLFRRWVLEDGVVVADTALPRGSRVGLLIGAANRDPARYAMADRFDIGRGEPSHLAFGGGIHFCLGAPLARLELQIFFEALAGAVPCFERLPGARRRPGFQFRGYSALPIAAH